MGTGEEEAGLEERRKGERREEVSGRRGERKGGERGEEGIRREGDGDEERKEGIREGRALYKITVNVSIYTNVCIHLQSITTLKLLYLYPTSRIQK